MKKYILILLISFQGILLAQQTPQYLIDNFFTTYQENPGKAVVELYETNIWTKNAQKDIDNVVNTVNSLNHDFVGEYYGKELVSTVSLTDCYKVYTYLVKYDRQPISFTFNFYKADKKWVLYSFSLSDDLSNLITAAD